MSLSSSTHKISQLLFPISRTSCKYLFIVDDKNFDFLSPALFIITKNQHENFPTSNVTIENSILSLFFVFQDFPLESRHKSIFLLLP